MGVREYDYIRGNTALAPERKVKEQDKKRDIQRKERERQAYQKRKNLLVSGLTIATVMFALGATTLYLDGKIHDLQKQLLILEGNMKEEEDVNAAINVDMLKFASFDKIKSTAENELGMVYPSSESTISIDMSKEYFSHLKNEESKKSGLLQKIIAPVSVAGVCPFLFSTAAIATSLFPPPRPSKRSPSCLTSTAPMSGSKRTQWS